MTDRDPFVRWAREAEDRPKAPTDLIPAATVVLLRDGPDGVETLMLRRDSKLEFAGGMWVFPGGRVDPGDHDSPETSDSSSIADELAPARRAAVREAREETGLEVDEEALVVLSYWEPPAIAPKRFSTWFFLAGIPAGEGLEITVDGGEITAHAWLRPSVALARRDLHEIELVPPTWVTLHDLARYDDTESALAAARSRQPEQFRTKVATTPSGIISLWHGDSGYEDADAERPGPRHRLNMFGDGWRYERSV